MKRLFVAMPYGIRKAPLDFEEPDKSSTIDFDAVWQEVLQPAVPPGFETKRADELRQPGLIDRLYNEWLFDADIVLADLTFSNPNVYYELGIRQALSRKGTVLVACKGTRLPFDVRNQYVIYYDYFTAPTLRAFQAQLRQAIENASGEEVDSPVHVFLPGLVVRRHEGEESSEADTERLRQQVAELKASLNGQKFREENERLIRKIQEACVPSRIFSLYALQVTRETTSIDVLEQLGIRLRQFGYFDEALQILTRALDLAPNDPELLREIGFVYRKKGPDFFAKAESHMEQALKLNDADPELHGMFGGLLKRRGEFTRALAHYRKALEIEPNNMYSLVTMGGMCGALGNVNEATKWYQRLETICRERIRQGIGDHWAFLCLGEAAVALGDREAALAAYKKALELNPPIEDVRSASEQLEFLQKRNFAVEVGRIALSFLQENFPTYNNDESHSGAEQPKSERELNT